jgi:hypothetical protein
MDSDVAVALLGAFLGAVVGGATSLAGSVIVNRMQLKRQMRIRMYDELLPQLSEHFTRTPWGVHHRIYGNLPRDFERIVTEVERASVIAGRSDAAKVKKLRQLVDERGFVYYSGVEVRGEVEEFEGDRDELEKVTSEIGRVVFELKDYLEGKLD